MRFNAWNPLYHLVCGPRDLLLRGELLNPTGFWLSAAGAVLLLAMASRVFVAAQYKIAERA
jgi:ABC-type polysaccharide/polyol phosphate export permease